MLFFILLFLFLQQSDDDGDKESLPEWAKLAKRKTWAVTDADKELLPAADDTAGSKAKPVPPKPATRTKPADSDDRPHSLYKQDQMTNVARQLHNKVSLSGEQTEQSPTTVAGANETPSSKAMTVPDKLDDIKLSPSNEKPSVNAYKKSANDNMTLETAKACPNGETQANKETIVIPKAKFTVAQSTSGSSETPLTPADPPWKASLKQRTG